MARLDWAFRCHTFDVALERGLTFELHLTPETDTFLAPCPPRLATAFSRGRRGLKVAAEVHDDSFGPEIPLEAAVAEWRGWGWRVIVTDVVDLVAKQGDALLSRLETLRPDAVTVDLSRPGRPGSPATEKLVDFAKATGVELHAHGVDSEAQRAQAVALGAVVGRGRVLGTPGVLLS